MGKDAAVRLLGLARQISATLTPASAGLFTTGVVIGQLNPGEYIPANDGEGSNAAPGLLSVPVAWNGSTPTLHVLGGTDPTDLLHPATLGTPDTAIGASGLVTPHQYVGWSGLAYWAIYNPTSTPINLVAKVDNNAGGNPGSTLAQALVSFLVFPTL